MIDAQLLEPPVLSKASKMKKVGPACPLTGSQDIEVLESFPSTVLNDRYQRDIGINVTSEFSGIDRIQMNDV